MIPDLAAVLPPGLASFADGLEVGAGPGPWHPASGLRDRATLARLLSTFGRSFAAADERALLSYWTQFYFATLVIPAVAATLCLRKRLPLALDTMDFALDGSGLVKKFRLRDQSMGSNGALSFAPLIEDHLAPFIDACAAQNGLSRRTLWCNAGAMFDYAVHELAAAGATRMEAAIPEWPAKAATREPQGLLFQPYRSKADGATRKRRFCCLRFKVPGVPSCGGICPVTARSPNPMD